MDDLILANVYESAHSGTKDCFCGKPAVEDHEFYFCSTGCARADSLRTLGGQGDCHYRNVMQKARDNPPTPQHTLARHKSEQQLRTVSIARRASASRQSIRPPKPTKTLPTLKEEDAPAILIGEARCEGKDTSVQGPPRPFEPRNESVAAQQAPPPPQRTLKRSLTSKAGLNKNIRDSVFALFRKKSQKTGTPSAKVQGESSVTGAMLQKMEEEDEEEVRQSTGIRRSRVVRRSVSFAGLNSQIESRIGGRGSVMETIFQLRQAWDETTDITGEDLNEGSDEDN
ncbi:hypothetical protein CY34DRAFT_813360 [Suillus luteus UH-Slu-Lm8-n1]|uniref:Unplaced genomic scaffold CY34scaffold_737, whole genome shotgun sequence n=1 Tax=Suillus luteus UH-Slu-Lm8-n1 TaxID=930992 RepID=A0A0D0AHL8_9AGAM|nr:hypothetical protein CY34DRAFT_813360 [Suillus luteus UH-Slu-Lm8-n1]